MITDPIFAGEEVRRLETRLLDFSPSRQWRVVTVTFPSTANTDMDIRHDMVVSNPEHVTYQVLQSAQPVLVYHDRSSDRVPWTNGLVRLRATAASAQVTLLLMVNEQGSGQEELPPAQTTELVIPTSTGSVRVGPAGSSAGDGEIGPGVDVNGKGASNTIGDWSLVANDGPMGGGTGHRALSLLDRTNSVYQPLVVWWTDARDRYAISPAFFTNGAKGVDLGDTSQSGNGGRFANIYGQNIDSLNGFKERGRTAFSGAWTAIGYSGANFTGSGTMTWTVDDVDHVNYQYMRHGNTCWMNIYVNNTTVGGTLDTDLRAALPAGINPARLTINTCRVRDNGTWGLGVVYVNSGTSTLNFQLSSGANWQASANLTSIQAQIFFETL